MTNVCFAIYRESYKKIIEKYVKTHFFELLFVSKTYSNYLCHINLTICRFNIIHILYCLKLKNNKIMKKNLLWSLLAVMMVAVMSFSFVSCGDDDDDDAVAANIDSAIAGKWYKHSSGYTIGYDLRANGEYWYTEYENNETPEWFLDGRWTASNNTLTLYVNADEEKDAKVKVYTYSLSEDGQTLYRADSNGDKVPWTRN